MASKFCFSFLVLFLSLQFNISHARHKRSLPVIKFISALPKGSSPVIMNCKAGGYGRGSYTFKPVDNYLLKAVVNDTYYCLSTFGMKFTSVHAFDPARDKGHATIFWKVDLYGFSISYRNSSFKVDAPWESE
ncbi:unnamed protein product [Fraxinus pennsylvanica]|uniref:S-protein homolog n=1 Tax=Fraxinus pennsylvanica TaxID=56036 RepID=A0AAD1ZUW3_9LAMI|nr:unnamed protein product [Fraxinus pennsylvanica]